MEHPHPLGNQLAAGTLSQFFYRLFGYDPAQADTVKWVSFGKKMLAILCVSVIMVGFILTYLATSQSRQLLEDSIDAKGRSIAYAIARAAFVPLTLEDRDTLEKILAAYKEEKDIAYLKIGNSEGTLRVEIAQLKPNRDSRIMNIQTPVVTPESEKNPSTEIGVVDIGISYARIDHKMTAITLGNLAGSTILVAAVLAAGIILIRRMTVSMRELVGEARLAEELRRSNQELEQFAYVASHDLREPLRTVASYAQLLERRYKNKLDSDANEFIAYAVDGATRMQAMITDLLEYSRIGRQQNFEMIDGNQVLKNALNNLEAAIQESGAVVRYDPMPTLKADSAQLSRVFQNLIANALKYRTAKHPEITLRVTRRKGEWLFAVQDNGIGIAPEYFERIFVIFQRLHSKAEYPGTGIGLAVCKKIIERHGGSIWVESTPGQGSTFYFTIPNSSKKPLPS